MFFAGESTPLCVSLELHAPNANTCIISNIPRQVLKPTVPSFRYFCQFWELSLYIKVRGKNVSFGQKNIGCKIECTCEISENWNRGITVKWINALIYWWDICFPNIVDYDLLDLPTKHWRSSKRWSKESACSSRVVCILWIYEWLYYV